jgi:hypothetical protein
VVSHPCFEFHVHNKCDITYYNITGFYLSNHYEFCSHFIFMVCFVLSMWWGGVAGYPMASRRGGRVSSQQSRGGSSVDSLAMLRKPSSMHSTALSTATATAPQQGIQSPAGAGGVASTSAAPTPQQEQQQEQEMSPSRQDLVRFSALVSGQKQQQQSPTAAASSPSLTTTTTTLTTTVATATATATATGGGVIGNASVSGIIGSSSGVAATGSLPPLSSVSLPRPPTSHTSLYAGGKNLIPPGGGAAVGLGSAVMQPLSGSPTGLGCSSSGGSTVNGSFLVNDSMLLLSPSTKKVHHHRELSGGDDGDDDNGRIDSASQTKTVANE